MIMAEFVHDFLHFNFPVLDVLKINCILVFCVKMQCIILKFKAENYLGFLETRFRY